MTEETTLTFELTVCDGTLSSSPSFVEITVLPQECGAEEHELVSTDTPIAIPDRDLAGIQSVIDATATGSVCRLEVEVAITHTYSGDLSLELQSPSGKTVTLRYRRGGSVDNIFETYQVGMAELSAKGSS